mmetsp:Transcript_88238/g.139441  ORF Transcript_88238/g.139441 Transcript_88238/m.139441 type:complete len:142 (-) Transcript_88238:153-578(-)|eukprot:CAMPEP_0169120166 /NCGR_PEP_ID=MMETSP1015-20121227/31951_1 /TAXON_ID=342587 /ORGANISM="Karlodinium micrum, Strain CCMP2283" /LENGTH=141 /DNA_ID=CAMNT_0009183107 /DNA_START=77 /DNA_END=502 /DNA_ORIENTATION=-
MAATAGSSPTDEEGCRQRTVPTFSGDDSSGSTMSQERCWELEKEKDTEGLVHAADDAQEFNAFVFPHSLDSDCLEGEGKMSDDDDEDTDVVEELPLTSRLMQGKIFDDPEVNEKWKNRGWRAVQCCGGALLVLALIFDEMD